MKNAYDISLKSIHRSYPNSFVTGIRAYWVPEKGWIDNEVPIENLFHVKQRIAELANKGAIHFNMCLTSKKEITMKCYPDFSLRELLSTKDQQELAVA